MSFGLAGADDSAAEIPVKSVSGCSSGVAHTAYTSAIVNQMSDRVSETRASLIISSELVSGHRMAEILELKPSKIIVKGAPTGQPDIPEHPFHIAMFTSPLDFEERLEKHLAALLGICEQLKDKLFALTQDCKIAVHCTYLVHHEGGWTLTQDLSRRMASLPVEYVFAVQPRPAAEATS